MNKMKRTIISTLGTAMLLAPFVLPAQASAAVSPNWAADDPHQETQSTHLWIAHSAISIMSRNQGGIVNANEIQYLQNAQYKNQFEQGLYDADYLDPFNNGGTTIGGYKSHFYDPDTNTNYRGESSPTALTEGSKFFRNAGTYFQQGNMDKAFYFLGLATHYFTDSTQPMHAANFTAIDTSAPGFHTKFEEYAEQIQTQYLVTDANGNFSANLTTPEIWIQMAATNAKALFPSICNATIKSDYNSAAVSQYYADLWRQEVTPGIGQSLDIAQRETAGFLHLWFKTYVGSAAVKTPKDNGYLLDSKGNPLQAGKSYYLVSSTAPLRGLTYQSSMNWDYLLQSGSTSTLSGTPVVLQKEGDTSDAYIYGDSDVSLQMTNSDWSGYQYLTIYKKDNYFPYQDSYGVPVYLDQASHRTIMKAVKSAKGSTYVALDTNRTLNDVSPSQPELYVSLQSVNGKNWSYLSSTLNDTSAWQFVPVN
ncbi:MAG: zinc dependent phospholipase C family protein [Tumebacillaceae bacterium]